MTNSDHPTRLQHIASWSFCVGIIVVIVISGIAPHHHHHALNLVSSILSLINVFLLVFRKTPSLYRDQMTIFAGLGVLASGYACIMLWNNPLVIPLVPVFFLLLLVTTYLLTTRPHRSTL